MKIKLLCLLSALTLCVAGLCACTQENEMTQENDKYKLVEPTQEDFDNLLPQLDSVFAMIHDNYDYKNCENIYDLLFTHCDLDYVCPENEEQVAEYIAEPLKIEDWGYYNYRILVPEKDPLGRYGELVEGGYDDGGNYDPDKAKNYLTDENYKKEIIGHLKYSGEYIDWLIEGVWNGMVDHQSYFEDTDESTKCYYHDGFYYVPEWGEDRGGGVMFGVVINSIILLENNKYRVEFSRYDEVDRYHSSAVAVLGLKETKDGFRFWSIYELGRNVYSTVPQWDTDISVIEWDTKELIKKNAALEEKVLLLETELDNLNKKLDGLEIGENKTEDLHKTSYVNPYANQNPREEHEPIYWTLYYNSIPLRARVSKEMAEKNWVNIVNCDGFPDDFLKYCDGLTKEEKEKYVCCVRGTVDNSIYAIAILTLSEDNPVGEISRVIYASYGRNWEQTQEGYTENEIVDAYTSGLWEEMYSY